MKKLYVIITILVMTFGFLGCRKPAFQESDLGEMKDIKFTAIESEGTKGDFTDSEGKLKLMWNSDDVIHVYVCKNKGSYNTASGRYLGTLKNITGEGFEASFFGKMRIQKDDECFRFVYVGKKFTVDPNGVSVLNYGTQNGDLYDGNNGLGEYYFAYLDEDYSEYMGGTMLKKGSIFKLNLSDFGSGSVTMSNAGNNKITLGTNGSITESNDGNVTLNNISSVYYALVLAGGQTSLTFSKTDYITRYVPVNVVADGKLYYGADGIALRPVTGFSPEDASEIIVDGWGN